VSNKGTTLHSAQVQQDAEIMSTKIAVFWDVAPCSVVMASHPKDHSPHIYILPYKFRAEECICGPIREPQDAAKMPYSIKIHSHHCILHGHFNTIDEFSALRFTATGPLPAAKRMRILPMSQHAWWPTTMVWRKIINLQTSTQNDVTRRAVQFMHVEFVSDLSAVGSGYQRHEPFVPS
jgi:hypothetical protein